MSIEVYEELVYALTEPAFDLKDAFISRGIFLG
jgi:hypothetical protein